MKLATHPAANLFPMMDEAALDKLAEDIRAHGLRVPIVLHQGMILDGRNRHLACQRAGVQPRFETCDNLESPVAYVLSLNLQRRHLSPAQWAAVAAEALPLFEGEMRERQRLGAALTHAKMSRRANAEMLVQNSGQASPERAPRAVDLAAAAVGISHATVGDAVIVQREDPALFEQVKRGEISVNHAMKTLRPHRKKYQAEPAPKAPVVPGRRRAPQITPLDRDEQYGPVWAAVRAIYTTIVPSDPHEFAQRLNRKQARDFRAWHRDLQTWYSRSLASLADRDRDFGLHDESEETA